MIEDAIGYILGVCVGCILYVLEHFIDKLDELSDSIKAKV